MAGLGLLELRSPQQQPGSYEGSDYDDDDDDDYDDDDDAILVSLVEETRVPGGNHRPMASKKKGENSRNVVKSGTHSLRRGISRFHSYSPRHCQGKLYYTQTSLRLLFVYRRLQSMLVPPIVYVPGIQRQREGGTH